uniref:Secreted protein n=1 Tax=Haemonchus contortus TaxID=6289 RepID=A0A7I4YGJ9_HAECO|nr:unnamed protein product [Haemonchus contortus]
MYVLYLLSALCVLIAATPIMDKGPTDKLIGSDPTLGSASYGPFAYKFIYGNGPYFGHRINGYGPFGYRSYGYGQ